MQVAEARSKLAQDLAQEALHHKKRVLKMESEESIDAVFTSGSNSPLVATVKYDGIHNLCYWKRGEGDCLLVTRGNQQRWDMPPSHELADILEGSQFNEMVFGCELYAVDENGGRLDFRTVSSLVKKDYPEKAHLLRIALFDVLSVDGRRFVADGYMDKIVFLDKLIGSDTKAVHVVTALQGGPDVIRDMWKREVLGNRMEGLVIRRNGIVKAKRLFEVDMVVMGAITAGVQWPQGSVGSLLMAVVAPDGAIVPSSAVTVPRDNQFWYQWVKENMVGNTVIDIDGSKKPVALCKPERVLRVKALQWYITKDHVLPGFRFTDDAYVPVGKYPGATAREPRFITINDHLMVLNDKKANPVDVGIIQFPDFQPDWLVSQPVKTTKKFSWRK